jgi:hypothetical protein
VVIIPLTQGNNKGQDSPRLLTQKACVSKGGFALSEVLSWGLPVFASLALIALSYSALQVASRSGDYRIAQVWFGLGAVILVVRLLYWGITSTRSSSLRFIACTVVFAGLLLTTVEAFRSISDKRERWIKSNQDSEVNARQLAEEKLWYETPEFDLVSDLEVRSLPALKPDYSEPRLTAKDTRSTRLPIAPGIGGFSANHHSGEPNSLIVFLAKFYYEPEPNSYEWIDVTAHVSFLSMSGELLYEAFEPAWFERESNKRGIKRAEAAELIVAVAGPNEVSSYECRFKRGHRPFFKEIFDPSLYKRFRESELSLRVDLVAEREKSVVKQSFKYYLRYTGKPSDPIIFKRI